MPELNINGELREQKFNIFFAKELKRIYKETAVKKDEEQDGFFNNYMGLINGDAEEVIPFWRASLAHHKDLIKKPELDDILQEKLAERVEEDGEADSVIQECFQVLDEAGFFSRKRKTFWNKINRQMQKLEEAPADESEEQKKKRLDQQDEYNELKEMYNELTSQS